MNAVEYNRRPQLVEKRPRIGSRAGLDIGILQKNVAGVRKHMPEQGALTRAAGTGQNHRGEAAGGLADHFLDRSGDELHIENSKVEV